MKNTKMRKKMLISSLAMLMVATVSLGSATYAWFTSNTTSTAKGVNVKTAKTSTLEISKANHVWTTSVDYAHTNLAMFPTSTATGAAFFKTVAEVKTASGRDTTKPIETASGVNYVYSEQLNVKNSGDGKVKSVTIAINDFTNKYGRIALVPADENGSVQYPDGKSFKDYVYDTDGAAYDALSATDGSTVSITPDNGMEISVGDLGSNEAKYFNLYIWFEGQDVDCYDATAGQYIYNTDSETGSLSFTVTGTPDDSGITG